MEDELLKGQVPESTKYYQIIRIMYSCIHIKYVHAVEKKKYMYEIGFKFHCANTYKVCVKYYKNCMRKQYEYYLSMQSHLKPFKINNV